MSKKITLKKVRLSFPSLFKMGSFGGESTGKHKATFILDKVEHAEIIKALETEITNLMKTELKTKLSADKVCLKDGDELERPEFKDKMTIKAATKKRPLVIDRDKSPLTEEDNKIYAGCYVNAIVSLWVQNNSYGKRINAQLDGVQFHSNGEPFGDGGIDADEFDAFGDDFGDDIEF